MDHGGITYYLLFGMMLKWCHIKLSLPGGFGLGAGGDFPPFPHLPPLPPLPLPLPPFPSWNTCNKYFPSTAQLKKYVKLYHKNVYSHICEICDKGFHSMEWLKEHQKVHKGSLLKCKKCTKTFTMARAKKCHLCDTHGKKINLKCQHCGHVSHTCCTLYLHPNRVPLYCDLCPKGPWYTGSKLLAHKRKDHKWK